MGGLSQNGMKKSLKFKAIDYQFLILYLYKIF